MLDDRRGPGPRYKTLPFLPNPAHQVPASCKDRLVYASSRHNHTRSKQPEQRAGTSGRRIAMVAGRIPCSEVVDPFRLSRLSRPDTCAGLVWLAKAVGGDSPVGLSPLQQGAPGARGSTAPDCRLCLRYRNLYDDNMKTTLNLNDQLLADAKALAAQQRTSLTRLIEEGLQLRLRARTDPAKPERVRLPVFKGRGGLVAGVNPLSNKALLKALGTL